MPTVKFLLHEDFEGAFPLPVPAGKKIPDYFKKIPPQVNDNPQSSTIKRCMPFTDAMLQGFIIPLWADVMVNAKDGNLVIDFPRFFPMPLSLEPHNYEQVAGHPLMDTPYGKLPLKFINPWLIQTEPGYSCLITSPLNHMERRLKILDGVIDTDTYYNQTHFPFFWTGGDGKFFIPKGTPLVQVIPFKREEYTAEYGEIDLKRHKAARALLGTVLHNGYKQLFRHKKTVAEDTGASDTSGAQET